MTLVFTDVQGSTSLWERSPAAMRAALAVHDEVLRSAVRRFGGYEVKTEGDAFMVAFDDPVRALRWCLACQQELCAADWPPDLLGLPDAHEVADAVGVAILRGLRVRMGIHSGSPDCRPDPMTFRMDYFGPMVNRAARVAGAAHGGQIIVSAAVWEAVSAHLADLGSPAVRQLGEHRLKGIEAAERLVEIVPQALAGRTFPPPKTLDARRTNLPPHPASFVGRERELEVLARHVEAGRRLLTIAGPGGMGKTRLAIQFGALHLDAFGGAGGGGVWFADLSACSVLPDLCIQVGRAVGVHLSPQLDAAGQVEQLGRALADRGPCLVVLDNFEQLVGCGPGSVARWLEAAPRLVMIVTSRERLRLQGETVVSLPALALPARAEYPLESEAVRLFLERARAVRPGYAGSPADRPVLADIVSRLDGIPLAIELAAARADVLDPAALRARLARSLQLLTGGARDAPSRQATLRAAIAWSWDLLDAREQAVLAQCSVFRGGWTLEAAEAAVAVGEGDAADLLDLLQALREKSLLYLLERPGTSGARRFAMYLGIQEFAAERLGSAEREVANESHSRYFLGLAARVPPWFHGDLDGFLASLEGDGDNLWAALERALSVRPPTPASVEAALRAGLACDHLNTQGGPIDRRIATLSAILAYSDGQDPASGLLGWVHEALGRSFLNRGDLEAGSNSIQEALRLARAAGDAVLEAAAFRGQALVAGARGNFAEAQAFLDQGLALVRAAAEPGAEGLLLGSHAAMLQEIGELEGAADLLAEALAGHYGAVSYAVHNEHLINSALVNQELGRFDVAGAFFEEAVEKARSSGGIVLGLALGYQGGLAHERGQHERACERYASAIRHLLDTGELHFRVLFLGALGSCLAQGGHLEEADVTLGAAERASGSEQPLRATALSLHSSVYHVARARRLRAAGDLESAATQVGLARARLDQARAGSAGAPRPVDISADVRFAVRLLVPELARYDAGG